MELSAAGLTLLKQSEGLCTHTYLDVNGVPTIGYGHRLLPSESFPYGITEAQATQMLCNDVRGAEQAVLHLVKVPLHQGQFDALVDFVFNMGQGRLATSTLLRELNAGRYQDAARQLLRWDRAGTRVNAGLQTRRQAELALWNQTGRQEEAVA